jgi:hypothetical protein
MSTRNVFDGRACERIRARGANALGVDFDVGNTLEKHRRLDETGVRALESVFDARGIGMFFTRAFDVKQRNGRAARGVVDGGIVDVRLDDFTRECLDARASTLEILRAATPLREFVFTGACFERRGRKRTDIDGKGIALRHSCTQNPPAPRQ